MVQRARQLDLEELSRPWWMLAVGAALLLGLAPLFPAAVLLAGAAAFLLTLIRAEFGLYLLIMAVPFGSLQTFPLGSLELTGVEVMVGLTALAWGLQMTAVRESALKLAVLAVPALAYVIVLAISVALAPDLASEPEAALAGGLKEVFKWTEFLLVYVLAATILRSWRQLVVVLGALAAVGVLEALYGWAQFVLRAGPEGFIVEGGLLRAYGTFGQPNPFAGYLGTLLALIFGVTVGWVSRGRRLTRWHWLLMGAAAVMLLAVVMSLAGSWVGLLVAFAAVLVISHRRGPLLLGLAGLGLFVLILAGTFDALPGGLGDRLSGMASSFTVFDAREVEPTPENWAVVERMANWQAAWAMLVNYPVLGIGAGHYSHVYPEYSLPYWKFYPAIHAHNHYLTVLAETGVLGLAFYLLLLGTGFAVAIRLWRMSAVASRRTMSRPASDSSVFCLGVALGVIGLLVYISTHSLFDDLYVHGMTSQVALFLGMLSGVSVEAGERLQTSA